MDLSELVTRGPVRLGARLPWGDPGFSARMLAEHLDSGTIWRAGGRR